MLVRSLPFLVLLAALVAAPTPAQACPNGVSVGLSVGIQIPGGMILIGYDGGRALYGYPSRGPYAYGYIEHGRWYRYHNPYYVASHYWSPGYRSRYASHHGSSSHSSHSSHGSSRHVQAHDDHRDNGHGGGSNHRPDNNHGSPGHHPPPPSHRVPVKHR